MLLPMNCPEQVNVEMSFMNIRGQEISKRLGIIEKDVDRLFFHLYHYSPTFRNHLWFFPSFSDKGSRILRRSGLSDFDRAIRSRYESTRFGWDSVLWRGGVNKDILKKMFEEWKEMTKKGKR